MTRRSTLAAALLLTLATPWARESLESRLATHLLVQMPLLVLAGWHLAPLWSRVWKPPTHGGPGTALAISFALLWMLPRSMDAAVESSWIDAAKITTLALCVGVPLARSWPRLGPVARAFLLGNALPMLYVLSWLYTSAPTRICTYYLRDDQSLTGEALLWIAVTLTLWLVARCFAPANDASAVPVAASDARASSNQARISRLLSGDVSA